MRRSLKRVRICNSLSSNMLHYLDETVKRLLRLCLGRLDHDGLMEEQREIDRRSMEAIIQKPLSHIEGSNT